MPDIMKTIRFPGSDKTYEIVDEAAREFIKQQETALNTKIDGAYTDEEGRLVLTANGKIVAGPFEVAGGGGGGGGLSVDTEGNAVIGGSFSVDEDGNAMI